MDLQEESLKLHLDNQGKMGICCKVPLKDGHDLAVAAAVARAAMETGVARKTVDPEEVRANTEARLAQYCK